MLYGKYPFDDDNKAVLFEKIKTKEPRYDRREVSQEAIELMRQMLVKDPSKRPEAKEILDHPWFMLYLKNEFRDTIKDLEMIPKLKNYIDPALLSTVNERRNINDDDNLFSDCLLNKCMKDEHVESSSKNGKIEKLKIEELGIGT